jgi:formylglycine-generating enzyme required for sulfatase activity
MLPDVGIIFEDGLVTEMVFAVREESSALPLLQFALDQLFHYRDGKRLTRTAYDSMNGVKGALAQHAEATYQSLDTDGKQLARILFLRLIEPGITPQDATRHRARLNDLTMSDTSMTSKMREITNVFVHARLLTTNRVENEETVEVSHEALIREWKRLQDWLHYAREDVITQRTVNQDADTWIKRGRPENYAGFYRGDILLEMLAWAKRMTPSADESAFIMASLAESERQSRDEQIRQERELKLAQEAAANAKRAEAAERARAIRFRRAAEIAGVVIGIALLGIIFSLTAVNQATARSSQAERDLATAQFSSTLSAFEGQRLSTRIPGLGQIPETPSTPITSDDDFATATQIAQFYGHDDDVIHTFEDDVEMVQVPAGCFYMGSASFSQSLPINQICFDHPFWIDRFEVTNKQYKSLSGKNPPSIFIGDNRPVERITWYDAKAYCEEVRSGDARLPTEAEWEYAAAGPDSYPYPWGREIPKTNLKEYAAFQQTGPSEVGSGIRDKGRSWVGAYDMSGNVWEWVNSLYKAYPYSLSDGRESNTDNSKDNLRVLRGGSWLPDFSSVLRASYRIKYLPESQYFNFGFRCVRSEG